MDNSEVVSTFKAVVECLNEINIAPMVYGSLSLNLLNICQPEINDIDLIIDKPELENRWADICEAMARIGYKLDLDHCQEFIGREPYVSFETFEKVAKFANVEFGDKKLFKEGPTQFFVPLPAQLLKIYQAGLKDKFRQNRKSDKDITTIEAIKNFISYNADR